MQQFHKFITLRLCVAQHVSGASSPIIRSLQLHQQPLVFIVGALLVVLWTSSQPDHYQQRCYRHVPTVKPEAANAVVGS